MKLASAHRIENRKSHDSYIVLGKFCVTSLIKICMNFNMTSYMIDILPNKLSH